MRSNSFLLFLVLVLALVASISAHSHYKHNKKHAIPRNSHPVSHVNPQIHLITDENKPQQIMTSLTNTTGEMMVSWLTYAPCTKPFLDYNLQGQEWIHVEAQTDSFLDPMNGIIMRYIHTVKLEGLKHSHNYSYRVGDVGNVTTKSEIMTFITIPPPEQIVRVGIYGDFGLINSRSIQNLYTEVLHNHTIDMIVHVGDFAYDLHTLDGYIGDAWLNMMENITSHIPYMGCAGNHESKYNLTHYSKRFALWEEAGKQTKSGNNWWFSWDYQSGGATVHMVAINTEMYYDDNRLNDSYSMYPEQRKAQYEWLDADLASARARNVDWLIVYGHRPLYCSNVDDMPDCSTDAQQLRDGYPNAQGIREYGMEELLGKYNVDIYFTAHEHSYERTYPVFKNKYEVHDINTYVNPQMPVHIVTGSTGCQENLDYYDTVMYGAWSVVRSSTYGYGHLLVHNKTHLYWDQMLAEGEQGRDVMWIVHQAEPTDAPTSGPTTAPSDDSSGVSKGAAGGIVGGIIVSLIIGWCFWTSWYNKQVKATQYNNEPSAVVAHNEHRDPLLLNASSV